MLQKIFIWNNCCFYFVCCFICFYFLFIKESWRKCIGFYKKI